MQDNFFRALMLFLSAFLGMMLGVFLVPHLKEAGIKFSFGMGISFATAVILPAVMIYVFKQRKTLKTPETAKEHSEVGFVVDTFHELVGKLKEKEKELERLRSFAEEKAVSIESYNENILQSVPSGVISIDNEMKIKSINQAAEHILGINAKETIGKNVIDTFKEPLLTLMKDNKPVSRGEYQYITGDKRNVWLGISVSELKNASGEKIGSIFVFTDLTEIKALLAQVELKERLSQLGEMSAGISHELRNSMSVISGYAKLLSKKTEQANKPDVNAIMEEIKNMDKIISELLAFAKPTVLSMEEVDLNKLIKDTVEAVAGDQKTVNILMELESEVSIRADAVLLRQTLSNLFINALESMPQGGNIEIGLRVIHNKAVINIKDTGCGIPEDIKRKIFLPFYTTKPEGIGFGLALVQKIIISHGGIIEVESKEGTGSVFTITFPDVMHHD
jgi:PAS domain S-box-containing protein